MGIGDPGGEELIGGKQRLGAGALEHDRDRSGGTRGLGSGQQGSFGRGTVHGDLGNDKNLYRDLLRAFPQGGGLRECGSCDRYPIESVRRWFSWISF